MPTSSQILILQKKIHGVSISGRCTQCMFKEPAKCPVASVYSLRGCMPSWMQSVTDRDAVQILGKESAQLFKYHSLPRGLTSILTLDNLSGLLQWQALGGEGSQSQFSPHASVSMVQRRCKSSQATGVLRKPEQRPRSATTTQSSKVDVDPLVFDSLIKLGFSKSGLVKRADCVFDGISTRKAVKSKPLGRPKTASCSQITDTEEKNEVDKKKEFAYELSDSSSENDDSEEFNRIKPSMHMRRDRPDPRPRAAIFSFRDNEYTSHAEVKYLIETQIGVRCKSIQFDPLDVRSAKPGVHSRWIVDFFTDWDLHLALKNCLTVGKDKLLFYKHDDIAKREVSSFKYYMTVQEAKRKLKSKSVTNRRPSTITSAKRVTKAAKSAT
ncbi:uncharacterized protein LOC128547063 [Mercenaria mercenaria]|uniref:uncharacterized protein LOC128547063 n=1 Tax=Mercenaria mercenaria TaxID=6596 RepID=UPI00234E6408|nr:uncharacterized protein LOC128547063 [Mercenaria mercenaria]